MFYEWYKISSQSWKYSENRKKEAISISVFGYKNKKKYPIYVSKNIVKKNMFIYYWYKKDQKSTMFLSKILSCHINECFKINDKQKIKMSKRWTCYTEKSLKENKFTIFDLCMFWTHFSSKKKLGEKCKWVLSKYQNMLLTVMALN